MSLLPRLQLPHLQKEHKNLYSQALRVSITCNNETSDSWTGDRCGDSVLHAGVAQSSGKERKEVMGVKQPREGAAFFQVIIVDLCDFVTQISNSSKAGPGLSQFLEK